MKWPQFGLLPTEDLFENTTLKLVCTIKKCIYLAVTLMNTATQWAWTKLLIGTTRAFMSRVAYKVTWWDSKQHITLKSNSGVHICNASKIRSSEDVYSGLIQCSLLRSGSVGEDASACSGIVALVLGFLWSRWDLPWFWEGSGSGGFEWLRFRVLRKSGWVSFLCGRRSVAVLVGVRGPARVFWCEREMLTRLGGRVPCFAWEGF